MRSGEELSARYCTHVSCRLHVLGDTNRPDVRTRQGSSCLLHFKSVTRKHNSSRPFMPPAMETNIEEMRQPDHLPIRKLSYTEDDVVRVSSPLAEVQCHPILRQRPRDEGFVFFPYFFPANCRELGRILRCWSPHRSRLSRENEASKVTTLRYDIEF